MNGAFVGVSAAREMARDYDHLFKLLIIGDSGECVGGTENWFRI